MEKCTTCDNLINEENDPIYFTKDGDVVCESCEQNAWEYSNTLVVARDGEIETYRWCKEFGYRDSKYWDETEIEAVPDWNYHRTDGWRGYWNPNIGEGFTSIASGWSTGRYSDVAYKEAFNDLCDAIQSGECNPPMPVYFALGLTSNVFSMSTDIIVRSSDVDLFGEWVSQELGITSEDLENALR